MCDISTCEYKQKYLLHQIIFGDCHNPEHWSNYIQFLSNKMEASSFKMKKLMSVALDFIDQSAHLDDEMYIQLRLRAIAGSR